MNAIIKNSARLLSANVIAQAIGLVVYPILTRLYTPEDFGLLHLVMSIGGILVILSTAEYHNTIVLAPTQQHAQSLVRLSSIILLGFIGLMCLLSPFSSWIGQLCGVEQLNSVYWFLICYVLLLGGWNILNMYFTREKQFGTISHYKIGQSVLTAGGKLTFGYISLANGLLYATLIGPFLSLLATICRHLPELKALAHRDPVLAKQMANTYRKFPLFSLPRSLVNVLSATLPTLLLTPYFSLAEIGLWSMALTLAFLPISLIVNSIQQVLYQQVAELVQLRQSIKPRLRYIRRLTLIIVIPFFIGLYFVLPWLTSWLLGDVYHTSGIYIRWMLPWLIFTCLNGMICFIVDIFMQQRVGLIFECLILFFRLIGLGIGIYLQNFEYSIAGYCCLGAIALFMQLIWFNTLINRYEKMR